MIAGLAGLAIGIESTSCSHTKLSSAAHHAVTSKALVHGRADGSHIEVRWLLNKKALASGISVDISLSLVDSDNSSLVGHRLRNQFGLINNLMSVFLDLILLILKQ